MEEERTAVRNDYDWAMETRITATFLRRNISSVLDRTRDGVERYGETFAQLRPVKRPVTWKGFVEWRAENRPDDKFADDLEAVHKEMNQPMPPPPEWPD